MSNVRLYLPLYDKSTLLLLIDKVLNKYLNVNIIQIDHKSFIRKTPELTYKNICKTVFNNKNILILLGEFRHYELPFPRVSKKLLYKHKEYKKYYPLHNLVKYEYLEKNIENFINIWVTTAIFSFPVSRKLNVFGNSFKIIYITNFNKVHNVSFIKIIKERFNINNYNEFGKIKLWYDTDIDQMKKSKLKKIKEVVHRIEQANLSFPIIIYNSKEQYKDGQWMIIDGFHRLTKAFFKKEKTIKVKFATYKQIKKSAYAISDEYTDIIIPPPKFK